MGRVQRAVAVVAGELLGPEAERLAAERGVACVLDGRLREPAQVSALGGCP
ncbi:MAG: hypothetical protein HY744_07705 [Deltaproteobacteria bacterium]|nr:hypothetical protein [Deltaproteobacteria bacterium]